MVHSWRTWKKTTRTTATTKKKKGSFLPFPRLDRSFQLRIDDLVCVHERSCLFSLLKNTWYQSGRRFPFLSLPRTRSAMQIDLTTANEEALPSDEQFDKNQMRWAHGDLLSFMFSFALLLLLRLLLFIFVLPHQTRHWIERFLSTIGKDERVGVISI